MEFGFRECSIEVSDKYVVVSREARAVVIPIPLKNFTVTFFHVRQAVRLRDFDAIIFDDVEAEREEMRDIGVVVLEGSGGTYLIFIVEFKNSYTIFHGWGWFDGKEYGFIHGGDV